jgi:hypothetical protein
MSGWPQLAPNAKLEINYDGAEICIRRERRATGEHEPDALSSVNILLDGTTSQIAPMKASISG